ncbi:response regulator [Oceanimonas sp. MB9]|uniref:response regulator n=1 Tax=Oceanimonas sp. MB9 TaxID=2588453 RepID=UPI0013F67187|nr:response regulator [Oceanimonas sp. MB9]NHH99196.1 Transcriptional regulatory protein CseB [Oceanimonas sp. MB9]
MPQHQEPRRVLYVEDDDDIREIARLALEVVGEFEVMLCASGEDAVAGAAAFNPDIILLDVMMPGMDGPSTLTALRRQPALEKIPVAFMTAKIQPREIAAYKAMGAVEVIAKPFDPMTLSEQIRTIWHTARA